MAKRVIGGAKGIPPVEMEVDFTKAQIAIDAVHHMTHEGIHFGASTFLTLAVDGVLYVKIETSDDQTHMEGQVVGTSGVEVAFYEDPTGGMTGGVDIPPVNHNRLSSNNSGLSLTSGVTAPTDTGTTLFNSTAGALRVAGSVTRDREYILKTNSTYLMKVTSLANGNNVNIDFDWYEPTEYFNG